MNLSLKNNEHSSINAEEVSQKLCIDDMSVSINF